MTTFIILAGLAVVVWLLYMAHDGKAWAGYALLVLFVAAMLSIFIWPSPPIGNCPRGEC